MMGVYCFSCVVVMHIVLIRESVIEKEFYVFWFRVCCAHLL